MVSGKAFLRLGRMVEQNRSGSYTQILYGPSGSKLALMSGQTLKSAFVPLTAGATAVYTASGLSYYRHSDWLGSSRLASTTSGGVYYDGAYAPYGEPYAEIGTPDRSFTGQNQDTVSDTSAGLYDFMFREYRPTFSRWIAPDPAGIAAVNPANPQSWNRYAYVVNNPLAYVDPLGLVGPGSNPPNPPHWIPDPPIWWSIPRCDLFYPDGYMSSAVCLWTEYEVRNPAWAGPIGPHGGQAQKASNNGNQPKQTKQQCIDNFLKTGYGPAGNFMAKTMVPSFSAVSIFTNTGSWAKGEGATLLAKGALSAGPMAYGKFWTTTGTNLLQYPGQAAAASDALSSGAAWSTGGALAGEVLLFVGVEGSVFATTADLYARWTCRNVP